MGPSGECQTRFRRPPAPMGVPSRVAALATDTVQVDITLDPQVAVVKASPRSQVLQEGQPVAPGEEGPQGAEVAAPEPVIDQCHNEDGAGQPQLPAVAEIVSG